jgi:hypothetical protein
MASPAMSEISGWRSIDVGQIMRYLSSLTIVLTFDSVWLGFDKKRACDLKITDVLCGPYGLIPD